MKKIITLFAVFWMLFGSTSIAQAHFLATDNGIGGIIHIDPDDNPVVGVQSNIFIDLKDQKNRLQAGNCECTVKILKNDQEIASYPVSIVKGSDGSLFVSTGYLFAEKAVYIIRLDGKSTQNVFEDFRLNFDFNVEKESGNSRYQKSFIPFIVGFLCVLPIVLIIQLRRRKKV
jgi:hypothetical protein